MTNDLSLAAILIAWIPAIMLLFALLPPRRAVITAFLVAWLFLPIAGVKLAPGIPLYDKMTATCAGVLLAAIMFDLRTLASFRPSLLDLPMAVWCFCPIATSVANDLGMYDGLSASFTQVVTWGIPYFIGRAYIRDLPAARELAIAIFIGGVIYVPLCLIEMRLSPQLHNWVYGFHQHSFVQAMRGGGWRPTVFMNHGLMVAMWMVIAGIIGLWLWVCGVRSLCRVPTWVLAAGVLVTAVLCRSAGAASLLLVGCVALIVADRLRSKVLVILLLAVAPAYAAARGSGAWDGKLLVEAATSVAGVQRADSLEFRIKNEDLLSAKAREQPLLGWGRWGRNRVFDKYNYDLTVTDGLWIITFGIYGIVGLVSWLLAMLVPSALIFVRYRCNTWRNPDVGPAIVLALSMVLYLIDCIPNGMTNPVFHLTLGALASVAASGSPVPAANVFLIMPLQRNRPLLPESGAP